MNYDRAHSLLSQAIFSDKIEDRKYYGELLSNILKDQQRKDSEHIPALLKGKENGTEI